MAQQLLSQVTLADWDVSQPRQTKLLSIANIRCQTRVPKVQLAPKAELGAIWTPFPPSVFQGTGQEPRKSIVFSIPDEARRQIELIEEHLRDKLRPYAPQIDAIWHSSVKPPGQHPGSLRAKITLEGPAACLFIDDENKVVDIPEDWAGLTLIPVVEFRACYLQKGAAGMILEVVKVMTGQKREEMETDTAFL